MPSGFITSLFPTPYPYPRSLLSRNDACPRSCGGSVLPLHIPSRPTSLRMCNAPAEQSNTDQPFSRRELKPEVRELRSVLKKCPIYLIGPMGSGKSAVGKYLAYEIGFRFLDTDELIEAVAKMKISQIFENEGEHAFRDLESAILGEVQQFIGCCISTGGGIVLRQLNWGKLQTGIVVYLKAPVDVLVQRLKGDTTRPLLAGAEDLAERISSILNERSNLYEQADVIVPVGAGEPVDEIGKEVVRRVTNFIKANPPRLSKFYPGNLNKNEQ